MDYRFFSEAAEMADEALTALASFESSPNGKEKGTFDAIRAVWVIFIDGETIKSSIKEAIPLREQAGFVRAIHNIRGFHMLSRGVGRHGHIREALNCVKETCRRVAVTLQQDDNELSTIKNGASAVAAGAACSLPVSFEHLLHPLIWEVAIRHYMDGDFRKGMSRRMLKM